MAYPSRRRRSERWALKTRPDLLHPRLEAIHQVSSEMVGLSFRRIDWAYEKLSKILDSRGVMAQARMFYRAFLEEMWKLHESYRGDALMKMNEAIEEKYEGYGLDPDILNEIRSLFAMPYMVHVDVYVVKSSEIKVGEGDIVVTRKTPIYTDDVKVCEAHVMGAPIEIPVYIDEVEVGKLEI